MVFADYIVLSVFVIGVFAVGAILGARNKNSAEMFAAGGQSPWWASGLSAFMTMFSAGTFVVWGGIAFKHGFVAVAINLCYGIAALLVGFSLAGKWKNLGINSPAEFVELRFGRGALHFYTWAMMAFRLLSVAVSLYSLALVLVVKMEIPVDGFFSQLREPDTGALSIQWAILIFGGAVVLYTMIGGLWAVLMTDVLQFIVLNLAVLFVIPILLSNSGGIQGFVDNAPEGFFGLVGGGYTWWFLLGWVAIHYFVVGAEWAFVQRNLCVPTERDARKSTFLFGILYLVSPVLWLLPPMIYRTQNLDKTPEQIQAMAEGAYISACSVLPPGMFGLMLAAMFSATASMVSSQLNVFAGVLTNDILKPLFPERQDDQAFLVRAGRGFTLVLGIALIAVALAVPSMGGAEKVVVAATSVLVAPLLAPIVWGVFNKSMTSNSVWLTAVVCSIAVLAWTFAKKQFASDEALALAGGEGFGHWLKANENSVKIALGVGLPMVVLTVLQLLGSGTDKGWVRVAELRDRYIPAQEYRPVRLPALIVAWCLVGCSTMMMVLAINQPQERVLLLMFGAILVGLALTIFFASRRNDRVAMGKTQEQYADV